MPLVRMYFSRFSEISRLVYIYLDTILRIKTFQDHRSKAKVTGSPGEFNIKIAATQFLEYGDETKTGVYDRRGVAMLLWHSILDFTFGIVDYPRLHLAAILDISKVEIGLQNRNLRKFT